MEILASGYVLWARKLVPAKRDRFGVSLSLLKLRKGPLRQKEGFIFRSSYVGSGRGFSSSSDFTDTLAM